MASGNPVVIRHADRLYHTQNTLDLRVFLGVCYRSIGHALSEARGLPSWPEIAKVWYEAVKGDLAGQNIIYMEDIAAQLQLYEDAMIKFCAEDPEGTPLEFWAILGFRLLLDDALKAKVSLVPYQLGFVLSLASWLIAICPQMDFRDRRIRPRCEERFRQVGFNSYCKSLVQVLMLSARVVQTFPCPQIKSQHNMEDMWWPLSPSSRSSGEFHSHW